MKRVLFPILALLVVAGCATTPPADNPFLGPATVPPPGTGEAGAVPVPYYPPVPLQGSVPLGSGTRYGAVTGAPQPNQLAVERVKVATTGQRENRAVEGTVRAVSGETRSPGAGGSERVDDGSIAAASPGSAIRIVEPEPGTLPAMSDDDPQEPRRFQAPTELIDITELPEASGDSSGRARRTSSTSGQSTSSVGSSAQSGTARNVGTSADYAHDPEYTWLKGKLERSRVDGRWKLRYIPIDGETDRFGGSVVLVDSPLLDGYQPGQFVAVEGDLGNDQPADYGFAPPYSIRRVAAVER